MKLEKYLEEKFKSVWRAINKLDETINGNGKEGIKAQLNSLLTIKKYSAKQKIVRWSLVGIFGVFLLTAFWSGGVWAFQKASEDIAEAVVERAITEALDNLEIDIYED